MKFTKILNAFAFASILVLTPNFADAAFWNKKKKEETKKVETKYEKLTNDSTATAKGMFNVIKKKDSYYFEIPQKLLSRDMLVVNKLTKVPAELNEAGVNRGTNYENQMINFELDKSRNKVLVRQVRPLPLSPAEDAISKSIRNNYISPLIASFDVEAYNNDSTTILIKVDDFFNGKETTLNNVFNNINLGTSAKKDLSQIISIKSFPNNVIATSELTTKVTEGQTSVFITVEVTSSIVLLPERPMTGRLDSPRIGFFTTDQLYFSDDQQKVDHRNYIQRWRLEPSDKAAYIKGELVEPVKPIVFYIDSSAPKKWRKYLKQGIEEWQSAFEKIGFKNAIIAKELTDSMAMDADDVNYSQLMYAASVKANAMGPSLLDPRSGEILEADIMWWHNVISMLQQWITMQTGAINPDVRGVNIPDSIMGDAIRFVICHEVGHSLGLRHNMMGSWAITTDQLRSKEFTDKFNSTSSSIMDYARYNYVAQPGDGVTKVAPHIGPYDYLAIEYGYRWFGDVTPEDEKENLHALLKAHTGNLYKYSEAQDPRDAVDPRAQNEDLGDDAIAASNYGIANLKRVMPNIISWTTTGEKDQSYAEASRLYYSVAGQWNNYLYHVMANVGGIYIENTSVGDKIKTYTFVEKEKQKAAVKFLINEIFTFPKWLFDTEISNYTYLRKSTPRGIIEVAPSFVYKNSVAFISYDLLNNDRIMRMLENEMVNGKNAYTAVELLDDLHKFFFAKTENGEKLDVITRSNQKMFVDALITASAAVEGIKVNKKLAEERFLEPNKSICNHDDCNRMGARRELSFYGTQINRTSDALSVKRGELLRIKDLLKRNLAVADMATRYHYKDIIIRIDNALEIK